MTAYDNNLLNLDQVKTLKETFSTDFKDFISIYFLDFEAKEKELSQAIKGKKLEEIKKLAHALKGSSLNVGAVGLAHACGEIETASKQGSFENALEIYEELHKLYSKSKEEYLKLAS